MIDVVFGALGQAIPERVPGGAVRHDRRVHGGRPASGYRQLLRRRLPLSGRLRRAPMRPTGSCTARRRSRWPISCRSRCREHRYPLRFDFFRLREDSGGSGWHRGGCGSEYQFTAWADCVTTVLGDQCDYAPFGVAGGGPAAPNVVEFRTGGKTWRPPMRSKQDSQVLHAGDGAACVHAGRRRIRRSARPRRRRRRARSQPGLREPRHGRARLRRHHRGSRRAGRSERLSRRRRRRRPRSAQDGAPGATERWQEDTHHE